RALPSFPTRRSSDLRRNLRISRIDLYQFAFDARKPQFIEQSVVFDRRFFYLLKRAPDGFTCLYDFGPIGFRDKMRAQIRNKAASAEYQLRTRKAFVKHLDRIIRELRVGEQFVVKRNSFF